MNPTTQQHHIDAFLRGELNPSQLREFENLMAKDQTFTEQVRFEEKIQHGLAEVRKAELKARLDAIDVSTGWVGGVGQLANNATVKVIGGLITASVVGVLVFNELDADLVMDDPNPSEIVEITSPQPNAPVETVVIPLNTLISENRSIEEPQKLGVPTANSKAEDTDLKTSSIGNAITEAGVDQSEAKDFTPQVTVPVPGDLAKEEGLATLDSEVPEITSADEISKSETTVVDVKTVQKKNESLKYKYFDGKLFLYGDFNDNPYEILEINGTTDRRLFLFYNKAFYSIEITDKIQELSPIGNGKLIDELEIIRNNKL